MEEKKLNTKEMILAVVAVIILVVAGVFLYIQSKNNQAPEVEEKTGLTDEERSAIEARINGAPVEELTKEEKTTIEKRVNSAPAVELTPEEKAAIEARINQ